MIFECSGLKNVSNRYEKVESVLARSYNCEWNDEVHDSFKNFVKQCEECSRLIKSITSQAERICQELNCAHIDQEKSNAEKLNREVDNLCQSARRLM